jgi:hypothetical protein
MLSSGSIEHNSRPQLMGRVLGIVYRAISAQLIEKAGFTRKNAQTGAVHQSDASQVGQRPALF